MERRVSIESVYGGPLQFEAMPGRTQSRVADYLPGAISETDRWDDFAEWFLESSRRLRAALGNITERWAE